MKAKHFILFIMALMSYMSESALAYEHIWSDANGIPWTFNISGSNATLFGIYYEEDCEYAPCIRGTIPQNLIIPSQVYVGGTPYTVTAIGDGAFYECWDLETITIPDGVTSIGYDAFWGSGITTIVIPEGVTNIKSYTFYNCEHLTSVTIPGSVTYIAGMAFEGCNLSSVNVQALTPPATQNNPYGTFYSSGYSIATLYVPYGCKAAYEAANQWKDFKEIIEMSQASSFITFVDSNVKSLCLANWDTNGDGKLSMAEAAAVTTIGTVFKNNTSITSFDELQYFTSLTSIGNEAFYGCTNLASVTLPDNLTSIGNEAFRSCTKLTSITLPDGVSSIGYEAFYNCNKLTSVNIPDGITAIEHSVFEDCWMLSSITIPDGVTSIGADAFWNCFLLTSISIPDGVTSIGSSAFYQCTALTSINIPDGITSIEHHTFYGCEHLTSVNLPDKVTSIGEYAFGYCNRLASINIPEKVTAIGGGAFNGPSALTIVKVDVDTPLSINEDCFSNRTNATLYVPSGYKAAYEAADYWNEFKEIIETNTVNVGSTGFATYCSPNALDFSGVSGIKAYVASDFDSGTNTLTLTRVTEVPAGEGLYIVGTAGSYEIPETTTDAVYSNLLKGVTRATTVSPTDGSNTNFILSNGSHGVGFYTLSAEGELAGGKAYLQLPTASVAGVKALNLVFDDDATGIDFNPVLSKEERVIYNIAGQRVSKAQKGLYIIDGEKVFIK